MPLKERVFNYQYCGAIIERDLNAAINLARQSELVRLVRSEVTPVDKLRADFLARYSSRTLNLPRVDSRQAS
jgi:transposase